MTTHANSKWMNASFKRLKFPEREMSRKEMENVRSRYNVAQEVLDGKEQELVDYLVQRAEKTGDTGKVLGLQQEHKEKQADHKLDEARHRESWASYSDTVRLYELTVTCDRQS